MKNYMIKRHLAKWKRDKDAISPIVATLMLVLIAVAAASAFYIWESNWQNSQSKQLSNNEINSGSITISGSTTVNDLMTYAAPAFMSNHTSIKVTVDSIGSGSGLKSLEQGTCDIAMISDTIAAVDSSAPSKYPSMVATTIAYDGVVMIVSSNAATYHNLGSTALPMTAAYAEQIYGTATVAPSITTWGQLESALSLTVTDAHSTDALNVHYRADSSGTSDCFAEKYMGEKGYLASTAFAGYVANTTYHFVGSNGNTGMITDVSTDNDAIGFTSYGMVSTSGGSVVATTYGASLTSQIAASTNSIKNGVNGVSGGYGCTRPLILVTMGAPSGISLEFINFVKDSANNINFCKATGFVSLYA